MMASLTSIETPPVVNTADADEEPLPAFSEDLFKSGGWPQLEASLNKLPVFTVGTKGLPLQYQIGEKPIMLFNTDVEEAKKSLAKTQREYPDLEGCDLIQIGLGSAFRLSVGGEAMVVPGPAELRAAGVPEGMQLVDLPLFAGMEITHQGNKVLPLYMSYADYTASVEQKTHAPLSIFSLSKVVRQLLQDSQSNVSIKAPSASVDHMLTFMGQDAAKYQELDVDFFSRDGCPYCDLAVDVMRQRGLSDPNIKRVDLSSESAEEMERLGAGGVPFFYSKKTGQSVSGWNPNALTMDWLVAELKSGSSTSSGVECPDGSAASSGHKCPE